MSCFLSVSLVDACFPVGPLISLPGECGSLLRALPGRSLTPVRKRPLFAKDVIGLAMHLRFLLPPEVICGDSARWQCLGIRAPTQESRMQLRSARAVSWPWASVCTLAATASSVTGGSTGPAFLGGHVDYTRGFLSNSPLLIEGPSASLNSV